jgi:hypothetical protein
MVLASLSLDDVLSHYITSSTPAGRHLPAAGPLGTTDEMATVSAPLLRRITTVVLAWYPTFGQQSRRSLRSTYCHPAGPCCRWLLSSLAVSHLHVLFSTSTDFRADKQAGRQAARTRLCIWTYTTQFQENGDCVP